MMKRVIKILFLIFISFSLINTINATSLKDLKNQLAKDQARYNTSIKKQNEAKAKITAFENDLSQTEKSIDKFNQDIESSKAKIEELNKEIEEKKKQIDSLLSFLQVSKGDNVYLEYVFGASSFTDFIYRSAVVEQLTKHNDELVDDMFNKIEENKKLQEDLKKKIIESEKEIINLEKKLKSSNLDMDDLIEDHKDIKADLEASKKEVDYYTKEYKKNKCSETTSINDCIKMPYATGFTRPLVKATVTSNYGLRNHPTKGYYTMHNGIDLGTPTNTNVYASASGVVTKIVRVKNPNKKNSSCGGNMIYIKHKIDGREYRTVYMHMHTIKVKVGDVVTMNTIIGGSGGGESYDYCTTGPHLHFGILTGYSGSNYVNPRNYINFPAKGKRFSTRFN